jgi:hypothetical protein
MRRLAAWPTSRASSHWSHGSRSEQARAWPRSSARSPAYTPHCRPPGLPRRKPSEPPNPARSSLGIDAARRQPAAKRAESKPFSAAIGSPTCASTDPNKPPSTDPGDQAPSSRSQRTPDGKMLPQRHEPAGTRDRIAGRAVSWKCTVQQMFRGPLGSRKPGNGPEASTEPSTNMARPSILTIEAELLAGKAPEPARRAVSGAFQPHQARGRRSLTEAGGFVADRCRGRSQPPAHSSPATGHAGRSMACLHTFPSGIVAAGLWPPQP